MRLYGYWRSSCTWRVRIALAHKGIAYDYHPVNLAPGKDQQRSDAYRAVNPVAQVPTLELDPSVGAPSGTPRRLTQSLAIITYLEAVVPAPPLLPSDPFERAWAWQLAELVNSGIQPLQNLSVLQAVQAVGGDGAAWGRGQVERGLAALEGFARPSAGRFLVGDTVTIADVLLVPQMYNARRFGLDPAAWPTLARVEAACAALPAFQSSHPDRQPDAVPNS